MHFNWSVKTINEIRRERLAMLKAESGLTYALMSERLGRSRRDATLSQVAQAQPNTSTGKPRQIGEEQARALERAFHKEPGWMDRDPDFDAALERLSIVVREESAGYAVWPFRRIDAARVRRLSEPALNALEDMLMGALDMAERLSHRAA